MEIIRIKINISGQGEYVLETPDCPLGENGICRLGAFRCNYGLNSVEVPQPECPLIIGTTFDMKVITKE